MQERLQKSDGVNRSRRSFLKAGAVSGVSIAAGATSGQEKSESEQKNAAASSKLTVTVAGYQYDRVAGLADGRVQIEGCETQFESAKIGDMNTHVFSGPQTRDVTEIGLLPFILAVANEQFSDYSLLPVFPLRLFRHKSIFIRTDRAIRKPADLRGRRVGTPAYSSSSLTWIRGIMEHEYGVKPEDVEWVVSANDSGTDVTGTASGWENVIPQGISISKGPRGMDESQMLVEGHVDALFHPNEPTAYHEGNPIVARLFADSRKVEQDYFTRTGIFPIMHTIAVRNDLIDANSWLPKAVFDAYSQAKQLAYDTLRTTAMYFTSLPWIAQEAEETRRLMGGNYWPYGIESSRSTIEAILQYAHEQRLAKRKLTIDELFHPSTLEFEERLPTSQNSGRE
jgi:4,5-dihydroxyphthalate decarboxylase